MPRRYEIQIRSNPAFLDSIQDNALGEGLGALTGAYHAYFALVERDTGRVVEELHGRGEWNAERSRLEITFDHDKNPKHAGHRLSGVTVMAGEGVEAKWREMIEAAERIRSLGHPWIGAVQNSNSFARTVVDSVGLPWKPPLYDSGRRIADGQERAYPRATPGTIGDGINLYSNPVQPEPHWPGHPSAEGLSMDGLALPPDAAGAPGDDDAAPLDLLLDPADAGETLSVSRRLRDDADALIGSEDYWRSPAKQDRVAALFQEIARREEDSPASAGQPWPDAADLLAEADALMAADDYWRNREKQARVAAIFQELYPATQRAYA